MKASNKQKTRALYFCAALAVMVFAVMPSAWAQQAIASPDAQAMVHQPFSSMAVAAEVSGKRYLYVHSEAAQEVSVVDITDPAQPKVIGFIDGEGQWQTKPTHPKTNQEGDPDAPQNHIEYRAG